MMARLRKSNDAAGTTLFSLPSQIASAKPVAIESIQSSQTQAVIAPSSVQFGKLPADHPLWDEVEAVLASLEQPESLPTIEEENEWLDDLRSNWRNDLDVLDDEADTGQ